MIDSDVQYFSPLGTRIMGFQIEFYSNEATMKMWLS